MQLPIKVFTPTITAIFFVITLTSCATFEPINLANSTSWLIEPYKKPSTRMSCILRSSPHTFTTFAGSDNLVISIKSNNIVTIETSFEQLSTINTDAVSITIDNNAPVTRPDATEFIRELRFNETKSAALIDQLKQGRFAYVKLSLPTQNKPLTARFSLTGFSKNLLDLRICNLIDESHHE